jgi:hypothetical protein
MAVVAGVRGASRRNINKAQIMVAYTPSRFLMRQLGVRIARCLSLSGPDACGSSEAYRQACGRIEHVTTHRRQVVYDSSRAQVLDDIPTKPCRQTQYTPASVAVVQTILKAEFSTLIRY